MRLPKFVLSLFLITSPLIAFAGNIQNLKVNLSLDPQFVEKLQKAGITKIKVTAISTIGFSEKGAGSSWIGGDDKGILSEDIEFGLDSEPHAIDLKMRDALEKPQAWPGRRSQLSGTDPDLFQFRDMYVYLSGMKDDNEWQFLSKWASTSELHFSILGRSYFSSSMDLSRLLRGLPGELDLTPSELTTRLVVSLIDFQHEKDFERFTKTHLSFDYSLENYQPVQSGRHNSSQIISELKSILNGFSEQDTAESTDHEALIAKALQLLRPQTPGPDLTD